MKIHGSTVIPTAKVVKCILSMAPDVLTNRQSRLMAYRQFVCWVRKGQPLDKKYRVTLPACVVKTIREEFPSPDGNYEGFKECACESDISDSDKFKIKWT
jgi:ribosomal protein L14